MTTIELWLLCAALLPGELRRPSALRYDLSVSRCQTSGNLISKRDKCSRHRCGGSSPSRFNGAHLYCTKEDSGRALEGPSHRLTSEKPSAHCMDHLARRGIVSRAQVRGIRGIYRREQVDLRAIAMVHTVFTSSASHRTTCRREDPSKIGNGSERAASRARFCCSAKTALRR